MTLYNGVDSASPGSRLPRGTSLLFGYIGAADLSGRPDAAHIWTLDEWNLYLDPSSELYGGPNLRCVPVYTHDYPGDPKQDADNAADALTDLGWETYSGRLVYWDAELLVDPAYCDQLSINLMHHGFRMGKYGSVSAIENNPPVPGGTWFAKWQQDRPTAIPPSLGVAWQWASSAQVGGDWDLTVASHFVYANAGRGMRRRES